MWLLYKRVKIGFLITLNTALSTFVQIFCLDIFNKVISYYREIHVKRPGWKGEMLSLNKFCLLYKLLHLNYCYKPDSKKKKKNYCYKPIRYKIIKKKYFDERPKKK